MSAEPKLSHELLGHFANKLALSKLEGVRTMTPSRQGVADNPLLADLTSAMHPGTAPAVPATIEGGDQ